MLPSFAADPVGGGLLNVNADTAAAALACTLKAEKLVFLSDVPGLFLDPADPASLITRLTAGRARTLIAEGVISGGMIPKVEAALDALDAGVGKIHFVDGRVPHSVLLEIYSDRGVGTEVVRGVDRAPAWRARGTAPARHRRPIDRTRSRVPCQAGA